MAPTKELIGASTRLLLLSVLAREANYGYAIIRAINKEGEGLFVWQEGTVYPILHKLEKEELVRTQWQEADTGRKRKYYYITATGRGALATGTEDWAGFHKLITALGDRSHG
ncbi:MAG: PadR family transcriptional regulator [Candidatus Hydrogenedentes bacterium]|nr:PadR family transcriptional regulator [Candidatus Hydrogenedentota bacterium]